MELSELAGCSSTRYDPQYHDGPAGRQVEVEQILCGGAHHHGLAVEAHVQHDNIARSHERAHGLAGTDAGVVGLGRAGAE